MTDTSIPKVHLYETVQNNKIVVIGGWLTINTDVWTTIAKNLPPAKIKVFTTVPVDILSNINNAIKFRITERGELDARLVCPNTSNQILYADFFITYITV